MSQNKPHITFLLGTLALNRGGVTRVILSRMRLYAYAGMKVQLLLVGHGAHENHVETTIRRTWELPDSVEIRYFWREAAPNGGGTDTEPVTHSTAESGLTAQQETKGNHASVRFHDNDVLVKIKRFDQDERLFRTDHYDIAKRAVLREYFDPKGRHVRSDTLHPETGKATIRRWFDRSQACWLTSWLETSGFPGKAVRHLPSPVSYDDYGQVVAEWIDQVLADVPRAILFSDRRYMDPAVLAVSSPTVRKVAVLHSVHTHKPYRANSPVKAAYLPLLNHLDSFDAVVALTARQRDDIVGHYGGHLTVIAHPAPAAPEVNMPREDGLLVSVSRLEPEKGLDNAIRAFATAVKQVPNARFDIYGTGSQARPLKSLAQQLGVADSVRFPGFTDRALEVFAGASAAVMSSKFEGFGLVLLEAMQMGTPVMAYDFNYGPAEAIRNGVDGLIVPYGDIDAMAEAMVRVLGDPDFATSLGERAREVRTRFSADRWAREWIDLTDKLGGGGTGQQAGERQSSAGARCR